jgi:hypothetical protein
LTDNANAAVAVVLRAGAIPVFLRRALDDVLDQTFTDWTAVVLHDAENRALVEDAVAAVANRAQGRIQVVQADQASGREEALNIGVLASQSRFLAIHDDTDTWAPAFLATAVDFLNGAPEQAVATRCEVVYESLHLGEIREHGREPLAADKSGVTFHEILRRNFVPPISLVYARALHDKIGYYDPASGARADWEFLLRALMYGPVAFLDGPPLASWHRPVPSVEDPASERAAARLGEDAEAEVRDRLLRQDLERHGGLGVLLTLADEFRRLHETTHDQTAHLSAADARVEAGLASLAQTVNTGTNRLTAQFDLLTNEIARLASKLDDHDDLVAQIRTLQKQVVMLDRRIKSRTFHARVKVYLRAARRYARHG